MGVDRSPGVESGLKPAAGSPATAGGAISSTRDLDDVVGGYAAAARAANTWRSYRSDFARFERWCTTQTPPATALPATPATLARYLAVHARQCRPSTLSRWCSAIATAHDLAGHPSPTRDQQVRTVLAGIRRTHRTRPTRVAAATPDDLRAMLTPLDPAQPADARDRAVLLIGFAGALRRAELAALTLDDLAIDADGLRVFIAASKTDPAATGHTRGIAYGAHPVSCPVRAWQAWLTHRHPAARGSSDQDLSPTGSTGPHPSAVGAFVAVDRWGRVGTRALSDRSIARIVAARAAAAGLAGHWAGHSLRRGFATTSYGAGASEVAIMRHGRWRSSSAMRGYIDEGTVWTDNPTTRLGL